MTNDVNSVLSTLPQYYQRHSTAKPYDQALFLAGRGLQSAELNDIQAMSFSHAQGIGDALFQEGDVISGAHCEINADTGEATLEAGKLYLHGAVRLVAGAHLTLPLDHTVIVGIRVTETVVTELTDATLRDPALGTRNYQEPGAARLQRDFQWAYQIAEDKAPTDSMKSVNTDSNESDAVDDASSHQHADATGFFYPIYTVIHGQLIQPALPPHSDAMTRGLARYDVEAHGNYVVNGLSLRLLASQSEHSDKQIISISEGKAHINGFEVELTQPIRETFARDPDLASVTAEPHPFVPDKNRQHQAMTLSLQHHPIMSIRQVSITREKTVTLTHGAYASAIDALPDKTVVSIVRVSQGTTRYHADQDYRFEAGQIDWSLAGKEPASGSQYTVVCHIRDMVSPESVTDTSCVIRGAVTGSLVLVDYTWCLPRYDVITLNQDGQVQRIKGAAQAHEPLLPPVPGDVLALAGILQTGNGNTPPEVKRMAVHGVSMATLQKWQRSLEELYAQMAQLTLRHAANQQSPAVKKGLLVDPFLNEAARDAGVAQTAAIVDQCLTLPIEEKHVTIIDQDDRDRPSLLPFTLEVIKEQPLCTTHLSLWAYAMEVSLPALVQLTHPVDRWTVLPPSRWTSRLTQRFSPQSRDWLAPETSLSELSDSVTEIRPLTLAFTVEGLQAGETLTVLLNGAVMPVTSLPAQAASENRV